MAQVVSHRHLTADARFRAQFNPCGICDGQSGTGTGFSPSSSVFPSQYIIPPSLSKFVSSGEYANVSKHPRLGTRRTSPSGRKRNIWRVLNPKEERNGISNYNRGPVFYVRFRKFITEIISFVISVRLSSCDNSQSIRPISIKLGVIHLYWILSNHFYFGLVW
jgi:hypothetical protein